MATSNDRILLEQLLFEQMTSYGETNKASYFEIFTATELLKDRDLAIDEIEDGIAGNGGDGGIDSLYAFINGELIRDDGDIERLANQRDLHLEFVLIQSKTENSYGEKAISTILSTILDLFDLEKNIQDLKGKFNSDLLGGFEIFRTALKKTASKFPKISVNYYYASLSIDDPHPNVNQEADKLLKKTKEMMTGVNSQFTFVNCLDLLEMARRKIVTSHGLKVSEAIAAENGGYVCLVKITDLMNLLSDEKGQLRKGFFDQNVRDYEGDVEVNAAIQRGLSEQASEDFWWLNNGITIIGAKASLAGKILTIEDVQIVNGQQTSTEIFKYISSISNPANEKRSVLVRVLVSSDDETRDIIIKATNSQTSIKVAQLRATDKIHRDIEQFFKANGLFYDRRKNYYRNLGKPQKDIISIPYLAQGLTAVLSRKPHEARAKPSSLLKDENRYGEIFDPNMPLDVFLNIAKAGRNLDKVVRRKREINGYRDVFFHTLLFSVGKNLKKTIFTANDLKYIEIEELTDQFFEESFQSVYERLSQLAVSSRKTITQVAKNSDSSSQVMALLGEVIPKI